MSEDLIENTRTYLFKRVLVIITGFSFWSSSQLICAQEVVLQKYWGDWLRAGDQKNYLKAFESEIDGSTKIFEQYSDICSSGTRLWIVKFHKESNAFIGTLKSTTKDGAKRTKVKGIWD